MTTTRGSELAEFIEAHLSPLNEIDETVATSSAECNFEDYEAFKENCELTFFEREFKGILTELKKLAESIVISGEKVDARHIFEESQVAVPKFCVFIWYFLENGKNSDATEEEVEKAVLAGSAYIAMCSLPGANYDLFQIGLYGKCLKVTRNCCQTVRIGETVNAKKGKTKGATKKPTGASEEAEDAPTSEAIIGPPRIAVDSAERFLDYLTTQFYAFLASNTFSLDPSTLLSTMEMIEDVGRLDLDSRTCTRTFRANSVHEFRSLENFTDRYSSFVNVLIESKYVTRGEMTYGRLIRPRLALMPFPDESNKTSKISTERKRAGELTVCIVLSRISRDPGQKELKLIKSVVAMIYHQCPDLAEFRTNISQFIFKILEAMPYQYAYDFLQLMHLVFKGKGVGVKSLSTELTNILLTGFDFSSPDPGSVDGNDEKEDEDEEDQEMEEADESEKENEGSEDEDEEEVGARKQKRKEEKKKKEEKKQKAKTAEAIPRFDAMSILYNIVYMACLDKSPSLRLHGAHSLAKVLENPDFRMKFQQTCQKHNGVLDKKYGDVGDNLNETLDAMNEAQAQEDGNKKKKATDLIFDEQQIIQKFNKLKMMNKGEARVENDVIYMIIRKLATDDKAPLKKSSCQLLKFFLSYTDEEVKFDVVLSILQKLCRDKTVSVRKASAEAITDLMLQESVVFKETLSSKWLHSLITMLNDTDNDVTEHARKLIMKVLTPILEETSDLTWTLLDTIESVTNHRQYLMTTLKDAVREKLVKRSVMESMKTHIKKPDESKTNGAWMVLSQLCVQFEANVDFAIEEFHSANLSVENNHVQYMIHVIENNIFKIEPDVKEDLEKTMRRTLTNCALHSSHARSVYHCLAKLMDGIGDRANNGPAFREFADDLLVRCFDTIVQSFEMFKDKEEWKKQSERQERLLCTSLNIVNEVFSFSPQLIPSHERLGKTLSLIVNSHDSQGNDTVNPDMPSAHHTRPPTQMSEVPSSQKTSGGLLSHEEGVLFSDKVRAASVITLANMILAYDRLLKLMPMLVKQLQSNQSYQIRSNIVVAIGDVCASYKTDRYAPVLAASLCDPSVLVRRHAINQIARLISLGIFRFNGEIMIRMMLATLDANEDVRNDAKLYISECLQAEEPKFFSINFVQYMLALTQAKRLVGTSHDEEDKGQVDIAIGGGDPLARPSRIAIYSFMIESLDDRARFDVKMSICQRIFTSVVNGEYDFGDDNVQCLLDDALLIMASHEMQVKMDIGKNPNADALEEPCQEALDAAAGFMQKIYLEHYLKTIVPAIMQLREFLYTHRSPLQRKCLVAIRMICLEHKDDVDVILQDNRQLRDEMMYEIKRLQTRTEDANKLLDKYMKKVAEHHRQQRRMSRRPGPDDVPEEDENESAAAQAVPEDVQMTSPVRNAAPDVDGMAMQTPLRQANELPPKTPRTAFRSTTETQATPQTRPLSPKTLKKIRKSVGALIKDNEMRLNAPDFEDTQMEETHEKNKKKTDVEKDQVEEEMPLEQDPPQEQQQEVQEEAAEEPAEAEPIPEVQETEKAQDRSRSRRRKTPTYDEDESVDQNGQVWKKPKIVHKSPEPAADPDVSMNVTVRRSRRVRPSDRQEEVEKTKKNNKRKAVYDDEEEEEKEETGQREQENIQQRGMTPLIFDESKLEAGRQCSTPIKDRDDGGMNDVTFALNLSAITEKEEMKNRKSQAQILQNIFEEDEEEEEC